MVSIPISVFHPMEHKHEHSTLCVLQPVLMAIPLARGEISKLYIEI